MTHATVAAELAKSFLDFAAEMGANPDRLRAAAGLGPETISDADARVAMPAYRTLIEEAVAETGDAALPMRFSIDTRPDKISLIGLIIHASATLAQAMEQLNRYARLMVEVDVMDTGERFAVDRDARGVWIVDNRPNPNAFPAITEMAFGCFIGEFRRHFPLAPVALELEVTHPRPGHAAAYGAIYDAPVTFSAGRNAMRIAAEWLDTEFDGTDTYAFGVFATRADTFLAAMQAQSGLRAQIEAKLLSVLHQGEITASRIADDLGMSRQSLYLYLQHEGTSFAAIHDGLRQRMAMDYLSARRVSVRQTAYLVGFSEPASFAPTFKHWTGLSPKQFRDG